MLQHSSVIYSHLHEVRMSDMCTRSNGMHVVSICMNACKFTLNLRARIKFVLYASRLRYMITVLHDYLHGYIHSYQGEMHEYTNLHVYICIGMITKLNIHKYPL